MSTLLLLSLLASHDHLTLLATTGTASSDDESYRLSGVEAGFTHEVVTIGMLELDVGARSGYQRSSRGNIVPLSVLGEGILHVSEHVATFVQLGGRTDLEQHHEHWSVIPMLLTTLGAEYELDSHWGFVLEATYCAGRTRERPQRELEMGTGVAYRF